MSKLKTKARVSFLVSLNELNARRKLLGHQPLSEQDFFQLLSGDAIITVVSDRGISETIETKLGYIVV